MAVANIKPNSGYLGKEPSKPVHDVERIGNKSYRIYNVVVHRFHMADVEDPELYAAEPILKWQNTDYGKWVMSHSMEPPCWHQHLDLTIMGYKFAITAKFKESDYTFWCLKWGNSVDRGSF